MATRMLRRKIRDWLELNEMGGWNLLYNKARHDREILQYLGEQAHRGLEAGMLKEEQRQREIDRLPEPERSAVRHQRYLEVMHRARVSAELHLSGIPWFANPYFPQHEDQTPEEFDAVMAEWRRSISSEEGEHVGQG